ncbi:MAG: hypothetical protein EXS09_21385 [Gemmataceae bacterium]|nr:hypothetical protein [Gemmataceae bacterium]
MPTDSNSNAIDADPQPFELALQEELESLIQIHQEGFDKLSDSTDLYLARLADCRPKVLEQLPGIADWVRELFLRCLGGAVFLKANEDLHRFMETLKCALIPIVPTPTMYGWNVNDDGSLGKISWGIDSEAREAYARFKAVIPEWRIAFARFREWLALCDRSAASGAEETPIHDSTDAAPWPEYLTANDLANRLKLPQAATRKKLERLAKNCDCRREVESPRKGEAKWTYRVKTVLPELI